MNALFIPGRKHRIYDNDGNLCQLLQLPHREIFQKAFLAEAQVPAQEVHLPFYNLGSQMDKKWKKARPEALYAEGLFTFIDLESIN